jgi:hypothetical protein
VVDNNIWLDEDEDTVFLEYFVIAVSLGLVIWMAVGWLLVR